jgi:hypothetical protein
MNAQQARIFRSFSELIRHATGFASIAVRETGGIRDSGVRIQPGRGVRMLSTSATLPVCLEAGNPQVCSVGGLGAGERD